MTTRTSHELLVKKEKRDHNAALLQSQQLLHCNLILYFGNEHNRL
jgi:hypothetical protein